jgi:hypothetical protein
MTDHWFGPKSRGYGATPADWKGWAATAVFATGLVAASYLLLVWEPGPGTGAGASRIAVWALAFAVLTAVFVGFARAKTDGQWGWRWGK